MKKLTLSAAVACATLGLSGVLEAKSLYVIADINTRPTPINTFDIQSSPTELVFQASEDVPGLAGGAVGLGIDTANETLFVTYEGSNTIQLLDATNFNDLGQTTAPGASNLAGIVVDQGRSKVYTVDRETNNLYVYSWDAANTTLTLDGGAAIQLAGVSLANGIALDETRGRLYVGDRSTTTVRYFDTTTWTEVGSYVIASGQTVQGIAVDPVRNFVYTGNAYGPFGSLGQLVKHDLNTGTETVYTLPTPASDNIVGVAVDVATGKVYATTGDQGSGGSDTLLVFDSDLNLLRDLGTAGARFGDPTGLAVPIGEISFNPLNLTKTPDTTTVAPGAELTYDICFDNPDATQVTGITLSDAIPEGASFVSADNGGTLSSGVVTWDIGALDAGEAQCVQLTLQASGAVNSTITNQVTIESDQTPPTTTSVDTLISGQVKPVPTLSQWGTILLSGLVAMGALLTLRRRTARS